MQLSRSDMFTIGIGPHPSRSSAATGCKQTARGGLAVNIIEC